VKRIQRETTGFEEDEEDCDLVRELRYESAENVAADFSSREQRRAMKAVLEWFGLNAVCAWRVRNGRDGSYRYTTSWLPAGPFEREPDAFLLDREKLGELESLLGCERGNKARARKR
jgi:hypothetical protein